MRFTVPFQNFWLPLLGGAVIAIPAFVLSGRPAGAVLPPAPAETPTVQLQCGPFVESFAAMRAEAERIAILASSTTAPAEEEVTASPSSIETWREIAATARALDGWMWEASAESAPLSLRESAIVSLSAPLTNDMRADSAAVAGALIAMPSEPDTALLIARMQAVERAAAVVARALAPLASCEPPRELSYAPANADCETLEPEYQFAMAGPCLY